MLITIISRTAGVSFVVYVNVQLNCLIAIELIQKSIYTFLLPLFPIFVVGFSVSFFEVHTSNKLNNYGEKNDAHHHHHY